MEENMKNYYEILQVNENASKEIIEKAYKVLAKKYHPDLQKDEKNKKTMEKKLTEINEAYHILSDSFLKEQYDIELEKEMQEKYKKMYGEKNYSTETGTHYQPNTTKQNTKTRKPEPKNKNEQQDRKKPKIGTIDSAIELVKELYQDRPKRQEYKEMTKKDIIAILLTIVIVIAIGIILWFIPFTNGWMRELLFENPISQLIGSWFSKL